MTDIKVNIEKLNGENYFTWKYRMELLLNKEGIWEHTIDEKPSDDADGKWKKADAAARAYIALMVEDAQLVHIKKSTTAKEMWNALKDYHEKSTLSNKVQIMRKVCSLNLPEGGDMEAHIAEMTNLFEKLYALGEAKVSDTWHSAMLLSSLPRSYDVLVTALESRPEQDLTVELVKSKLIDEYRRRTVTVNKDVKALKVVQRSGNRSSMKCFFCDKAGHQKAECIKYKKWLEKQTKVSKQKANKVEENNEFCFIAGRNAVEKSRWIVDSGATCHMSNNRDLFTDFDARVQKKITVANGHDEMSLGSGTCKILALNDDEKIVHIRVENVLYVPGIDCNLISVKQLLDKGLSVTFDKASCMVMSNKQIIAVADLQSNLFVLRQPSVTAYATKVKEHPKFCRHYWHRVFGHRHVESLHSMEKTNCVEGMKINDCAIKETCEVCVKGKMSRIPFPKESNNRSSSVLDLIMTSDRCKP